MDGLMELPPIQTLAEFEVETRAMLVPPFSSKFGAVSWKSMLTGGIKHTYLIKGLVTENELSVLAGASQSGKTFVALDMAMAILEGKPFFGRKTLKGGVIYQAGEDPTGVRTKRIPAYCKTNGLNFDQEVDFVLLTHSLNLWAGDERTGDFIAECKHWAAQMSEPLRAIFIDTYAKASTGADEISSKDMGVIQDRLDRIRRETGAAVILVDHLNAHGDKVRGNTSKTANIDSVLICRMATVPGEKRGEEIPAVDHDKRKVRELTNEQKFGGKIKNGEALTKPLRFVLRSVQIGTDEDGDPVTSCIVAPPSGEEIERREAAAKPKINTKLSLTMKALVSAISAKGRNAPAEVEDAPKNECITLADWRDTYAPLIAEEGEDAEKAKERARDSLRKTAIPELLDRNYIKKSGDWVWRTGRRVSGIDYMPQADLPPVAPPELSPELQDLADVPF